jgi:hypothetical protein
MKIKASVLFDLAPMRIFILLSVRREEPGSHCGFLCAFATLRRSLTADIEAFLAGAEG